MRSRQNSVEDVLKAYQFGAWEAQKRTNCVCFFITEALEWARQMDANYAQKKDLPLFGLPISVKESIKVSFNYYLSI